MLLKNSSKLIYIINSPSELYSVIRNLGKHIIIDIFTPEDILIFNKNIRIHNIDSRFLTSSLQNNMYFSTILNNLLSSKKSLLIQIKNSYLSYDQFKYLLFYKLHQKVIKQIQNIKNNNTIKYLLTSILTKKFHIYKSTLDTLLFIYNNLDTIEAYTNYELSSLLKKYNMYLEDMFILYILGRIFRLFHSSKLHPYKPFNNLIEYKKSPKYIILYKTDKRIINFLISKIKFIPTY